MLKFRQLTYFWRQLLVDTQGIALLLIKKKMQTIQPVTDRKKWDSHNRKVKSHQVLRSVGTLLAVFAGAHYFDNTSQKEKEDDVVQPNCEHVYSWEVTPEVSPQPSDPKCLTHTYISHQNVVEDYNSGLIGTLLICKPGTQEGVAILLPVSYFASKWMTVDSVPVAAGSLDESGQQIGVHQEYTFLFGVFDETESKYKTNSVSSDNNVKYTINGFTQGALPGESLQQSVCP